MAANAAVTTDSSPFTAIEISQEIQQLRRSSTIQRDSVTSVTNEEANRELYKERKWDYLDPFEYVYDKTDPGYVMIFNHKNFLSGQAPREGTDADAEEIVRCFGRQGYNIGNKNVIHDATKQELLDEVVRVCTYELEDTNSLIVFVLSHGESDNKFHVYDDSCTVQELVEPFLQVQSMKDKPKIFIFQTCKTGTESPREIKLYINTSLTAEPNVLMCCSTLEGDYAYRDKLRGSWFIQELCRNIYMYGSREEILSILMRCNKCMAKNYHYDLKFGMNEKQTPLFISTLTRNFYVCRSKDRYFYIEKMNELREVQKMTDGILKTMTFRRRTLTRTQLKAVLSTV